LHSSAEYVHISCENYVRMLKVHFNSHKQWYRRYTRLFTLFDVQRQWMEPCKEPRTLKGLQMHITDGDHILVQDASEPLRSLTLAEKEVRWASICAMIMIASAFGAGSGQAICRIRKIHVLPGHLELQRREDLSQRRGKQ
jgi:hypothetical protein